MRRLMDQEGADPLAPDLSAVIPAFNEAARIGRGLDQVVAFLERSDYAFEVVVVDDGSADTTPDIVRARMESEPRIRLIQAPHRGKGAAVRLGMLEARGRYRYMADADLSTPIHELPRFLALLEQGADLVIGSREAPGSQRLEEPLRRHWMGRVFNRLVQSVLLPGIEDTQCGFKCFRGEVAEVLFRRQTVDGFAFDVEILSLARRAGFRVHELGVRWVHDKDSKVRAMRHTFTMLGEVATVAWRVRTGRYGDPREWRAPPRSAADPDILVRRNP